MAPAVRKRATKTRQPLAATAAAPCDQAQLSPNLVDIFNNSQYVTNSDSALNQLKKLYKTTDFAQFEEPFEKCVKKLLQSKQSIYFKTSCDFLCKFLQHVAKLSDEIKAKNQGDVTMENTAPTPAPTSKARKNARSSLLSESSTADVGPRRAARPAAKARGTKRKADVSDDEICADFLPKTTETTIQTDSTDDDSIILEVAHKRRNRASMDSPQISSAPINDHDRLINSCMNVADLYMQVANEDCRHNAVYFVCKFLSHVTTLDESIISALKATLPKRVRDRKPMIRAQAVLASRTFQDSKITQEAFRHHFYRDPELIVRKALLQIMDTKIFGYDFLVDSTQDAHEVMRKAAFQRLGKVPPLELSLNQRHRIIHNGLNERERQASYFFKTHTLEPWLAVLYDGLDLYKLVQSFDIVNYHDDVCRLLQLIHERDLDKLENNGTTTRLHHVVESFRERWLNADNTCLPSMSQVDEKITTVWLTLVKFCKTNQTVIKSIKIRPVQPKTADPNESIEKILDSQDNNDEVVELYERLTPDLVNLVDFLKRFVQNSDSALKKKESDVAVLEFIYHQIMQFIYSYEIGDELERKTVQEVLGLILKENLLTGSFNNFIPPIIKCLFHLVYSTSSNLMINYISELIHDVRSHLEDLISSTQASQFGNNMIHSAIVPATRSTPPRSTKKVRINNQPRRSTYMPEMDQQNLEYKIATIRVELEDLKDELDICIKDRDFDKAKVINNKMADLKNELTILHGRRCSIASDVSHMSMVIETEPSGPTKLSSTMIGGENPLDESCSSTGSNKDEMKVFKHHTNELIKCLQMYFGCLQNVRISQVPQTMLTHLHHLSHECLDDWFKDDVRVRSLMVACNGLTALVDKNFAKTPTVMLLLTCASQDPISFEVRTVGFKCLVDVVCQHEDLDVPLKKIGEFLHCTLREYGRYDPNNIKKIDLEFITAVIEGAAKLYYHRKLSSPTILSHLILWWYHPRTPSRVKQFIGVFLPTFVEDVLGKPQLPDDDELKVLLEDTFVKSIENLHNYILGPGQATMASSDMLSLINFLCNLIPISYHRGVQVKLDEKIDSPSGTNQDLLKYLKLSKNSLTMVAASIDNADMTVGRQTLLFD